MSAEENKALVRRWFEHLDQRTRTVHATALNALEPELISIAGVYRTGEEPLPETVRGKPTQVRLVTGPDGERLILEPLKG